MAALFERSLSNEGIDPACERRAGTQPCGMLVLAYSRPRFPDPLVEKLGVEVPMEFPQIL